MNTLPEDWMNLNYINHHNYSMYNYVTNEFETMKELPKDWSDYIPQYPPAQDMYSLYLQMGDEPMEAALKVLKASIGETEEK